MINKPRCSKASPKITNMALYCDGACLCAHQYYCPTTKRYENTPGFGQCKRLDPQQNNLSTTVEPPKYESPIIAKTEETTPKITETAAAPVERYTLAVADTADETTNKEAGRAK